MLSVAHHSLKEKFHVEHKPMDYPQNPIDAFANSAILDLRVRLAINFIQHSPMFTECAFRLQPKEIAALALGVAEQLIEQGKERGWVEPLPEDGAIPPALMVHGERQARFSIHQNATAQKVASELSSGIVPAAPAGPRRMN